MANYLWGTLLFCTFANSNNHYRNGKYYFYIMRFYDREKEQQLLGEILRQSKREARMTVLMGRRRIGKTELSLRCGDDIILYFFVGKKTEKMARLGTLRRVHGLRVSVRPARVIADGASG